MKYILNKLITFVLRQRSTNVRRLYDHSLESQDRILQKLVACCQNTVFGVEHRFSEIKSHTDFDKNVPVRTYEDFFPYIERCLAGEPNVIYHRPIKQFSKSSGTTNAQSKYIPISRDSLLDCHFKAARDFMGIYHSNHPDSKMFHGKSLRLGGSFVLDKTTGVRTGDLSAILFVNTPEWVDLYSTPDRHVSCLADWNDKLPAMTSQICQKSVTSLAGVPSWMLVTLRAALEKSGKKDITELWPDLELYMHGGINFAPYRHIYKELIPSKKMRYYDIYNASEGFFAFQDRADHDDMLLLTDHGVYFEFIDMNVFSTANPKAIPLSEVKTDVNYAVVITTNGGLWRYLIGDTVRFTSISPYRIRITGRTKAFINAFGEELVVENADSALMHACELTDSQISEYTAAPIFMQTQGCGAHQWVVEFSKEPTDIDAFAVALDTKLQELNSDYKAKRYAEAALSMPVINAVPKGTFYRWMESRGKLGGQNKVPRLCGSREFVEGILSLL